MQKIQQNAIISFAKQMDSGEKRENKKSAFSHLVHFDSTYRSDVSTHIGIKRFSSLLPIPLFIAIIEFPENTYSTLWEIFQKCFVGSDAMFGCIYRRVKVQNTHKHAQTRRYTRNLERLLTHVWVCVSLCVSTEVL